MLCSEHVPRIGAYLFIVSIEMVPRIGFFMPSPRLTSQRFLPILSSLCVAGIVGVCGCESSRSHRSSTCGTIQVGEQQQADSHNPLNPQAAPGEVPQTAESPYEDLAPSPHGTADRFKGLGGLVEFDSEDRITVLDLSTAEVSTEDLKNGQGLSHLTQLDLSNTQIDDGAFANPEWLQSLDRLSLNKTDITDDGLRALQGLPKLSLLWLNETAISDDGLAHLAELTTLQSLGLNNTSVTDAGLIHLREMRDLKYLLLGQTQITDAGLEHLKGLSKLKGLSLVGTNVTEAAVSALQQLLPQCQIVSDVGKKPVADTIESGDTEQETDVVPQEEDSVELPDEPRKNSRAEAIRLRSSSRRPDRLMKSGASVDITRYYMGLALAQTGDVRAALPLFTETVGPAAAHYNLGVIHCEKDRWHAGEEQFRTALRVDPALDVAQRWLSEVERKLASGPKISPIHVETEERTDLSSAPVGIWSRLWDDPPEDE